MADYDLEAKITADASGYEAGVKKAEKASKKLSTSVSKVIQGLGKNGLVGALGAVGLASSGLSATLGSVVKIARKVSETINECTNAYKNQLIAEKALDTAIQNNPFVTGESSKALLQFASDMQKVSNYGDDELIPMMTNLISLGRTEAETMQIMSVAMDMSAGMGISLDSAITQLNATLNGNIGRLGQQNAELKDLTEEELKQGKAVEILGEKFKGLSSATTDTSKQLQNIKGDFKEALGQFTLPSSDMWNKFWSGFYEKGIEVIKKLDEFLDTAIVGEKLADSIETQLKKMKKGGNKEGYVGEALSVLTDRELELITKYLEKQKKRNANEELILKVAKEQASSRAYLDKVEKQYLEDLAEEKRLKEEAEARESELAELRKKQAEEEAERQKQLAIQKEKEQQLLEEWQNKLFSIRIENLERQRELELKNEELTEEQKAEVAKFYGDQILAMKLQQIEKNREEALNAENVTEEARLAINLYYENEITQAKQEEEKKRYKAKKQELKEEEKAEKQTLVVIVNLVQNSTKKISDSFKKVSNTIKDVFSKVGNIFKKLLDIFSFNPDEALTSLLKVEDIILTFFVETLPKLPAFFASAVESVISLLEQLIKNVDWEKVQNIINSVIDKIVDNAPTIIENLLTIIINIAQSIINGLVRFVESGGWKKILDLLLTIQKRIEKHITDNIDTIVQTIIDMLPDLVQMLIDSIVSASKTLGKIVKPLFKLIIAVIMALLDLLNSDEVIDQMVETIGDIIQGLFEAIIEMLPQFLSKSLPKIIKMITRSLIRLPIEIARTIFKGLTEAFQNANFGEIFWALFEGLKEIIGGIGEEIGATLTEAFLFIGDIIKFLSEQLSAFITWAGNGIRYTFEQIGNGIQNFFNGVFDWFNNGWKWLVEGATWAVKQIQQGFEWAFNGIKNFFDGIFQGIMWAIEQIQSAFNWLKGGWDWFWGGPKSWFGWATGTNDAPHGLALVGEQGPELVKFNGGEQVFMPYGCSYYNIQEGSYSNYMFFTLLSDAGKEGGNTFNVTFNNLQDTTAFNMLQQLKQYNRQMAINGVI